MRNWGSRRNIRACRFSKFNYICSFSKCFYLFWILHFHKCIDSCFILITPSPNHFCPDFFRNSQTKVDGGGEGIRTPGRSFLLQRFSKPPPSATRPPLRRGRTRSGTLRRQPDRRRYTAYAGCFLALKKPAVKSEIAHQTGFSRQALRAAPD